VCRAGTVINHTVPRIIVVVNNKVNKC